MSPHPQLPKVIYGTARIAQLENKEKFLDILEKYDAHDIDTAYLYVCLALHYLFPSH
jgi:hypothetical protein